MSEEVELKLATKEIHRLDSEVKRLRAEDKRLLAYTDFLRAENDRLREALEPFAAFARAWERNPLRGMDDVIYMIHGFTEWEAALRLSDCTRARRALAPEPKEEG
jgi:predicted RNase H-like nuclease (RuvC/YqgF family)